MGRYLLFILITALIGAPTYAQTATFTPTTLPTTTPAATPIVDNMTILYPGWYESSAGDISRAGDWFAIGCGGACQNDDEFLFTDVNGTMHVRFYGDGLVIARMVGPAYGLMEVCANGWCSLVDNYDLGDVGSAQHTMLLRPGYYHVSVRNASTTGARLGVDGFQVLDDSQSYIVPTPTPLPSPTPVQTFIQYDFMMGGDAYTGGYSLEMSAGDVPVIILLAVIALLLFVSWISELWKR
ncbi:MAG: hypothetical protein AAF125_22260 [Chloroflexota bacterium]